MTAQAVPKTQELEDKINSLTSEIRRLNEFEIKSLKRDAEKLKSTIDYCEYYNLLGKIAVLENNKKEMIDYYGNAIKLNPNYFVAQFNYSISLQKVGFLKLAIKQAKKVVNHFPNNSTALNLLIRLLLLSCRFNEAKTLLTNDTVYQNNKEISKALLVFNKVGLKDDEAQYIQELSYSMIESKNLYLFDCASNVAENHVSFTIYVDLPIEKIFDLNWELAEVLADNLEDMRCEVLNFKYSSVEVLRERREYERLL